MDWGPSSHPNTVLQRKNISVVYSEMLGFNACLKVATSLMSFSVFVFAGRGAVGVPASFQGFCVPPPAGVDHAAAAAAAVPALRVPAGQ